MRTTGIVRRIDDLGRVVIPKEIRRVMRIKEGDPLEIFTENNMIYLQKYIEVEEQEEKEKKEKIQKYISEKYSRIISMFSDGKETVFLFANGKKVSVKKSDDDVFDFNIAIYYAMLKAGYKGIE